MKEIYEKLEANHFQVFHSVTKTLTKEEILNMFYNHRNAPYYPDIVEHLLTADSIILLLTNAVDKLPAEVEGEEDVKLEGPVQRWK